MRRFIYTYNPPTFTTSIYPLTLKVLVVGGGGGSSSEIGGGGGAGGFIYNSGYTITGYTSTSIVVGAGGDGVIFLDSDPTRRIAKNGASSKFLDLEAYGGGGSTIYVYTSNSGASSGGNRYNGAIGVAVSGQGNIGANGGSFLPEHYVAGGGGGAGAAGIVGTRTKSGDGGSGKTSTIYDDTTRWYAGGGGGAGYGNSTNTTPVYRGAGGLGGGGLGQLYSVDDTNCNGVANTGGGAGGGTGNAVSGKGYKGGSGIVIVRYTSATQIATGGTVTQVGGDWVHTFTNTGITEFYTSGAT